MREQRLVFGELAELYEQSRPGYPAAAVERVIELAGQASRAVEVGAGTGKLTRLLAARGVEVLALEPSAEMAAVGARVCEDLPVSYLQGLFEDHDLEPGSADIVAAAQSWHWVPHARRVDAAARVLRPGGVLALLWNIPRWGDTPLRRAIDEAYARWAPDIERISICGNPSTVTTDDPDDDLRTSSDFGERNEEHFRWTASYDTAAWISLSRTQSGHMLLPEDQRSSLLDDVAAAIDAHGGTVELEYVTLLVWARRT